MKVLIINCVCGIRSTGRICTDIAQELMDRGNEVRIAYGRVDEVPERYKSIAVRIGGNFDLWLHAIETRIFDNHGFASKRATEIFLKWATEFNPDMVWLHNLHGYYINVEMLFDWIKKHPEMQVKWTLHDCWAFTGHCSHFTAVQCKQWKTHCSYCFQLRRYPKCYLKGNVHKNFDRKKAAFTGVKNMTLITPSKWLASLVKQSFLKEYPVEVHYNTIDTNVFKPTPSDFREKNGMKDKIIVLGVASTWDDRKGLKDFYELANMLDIEKYKIILVGLSKKQMRKIPQQILAVERTNNAKELAEIYTAADVFINPTYEDNYPTVNLEAEACGTSVITYNTGGCSESVSKDCVVDCGDLDALVNKLYQITIEQRGHN